MNRSPALITATRFWLLDVHTENVVPGPRGGVGLADVVAAVGDNVVGVGNSYTFVISCRFCASLDRFTTVAGLLLLETLKLAVKTPR